MWKKIGKGLIAVILFVLVFLFSSGLGSSIYRYLEQAQTPFLCRYASDGQFDYNVYFSKETEQRYGVPTQLPFRLEMEESLSGLSEKLTKYQLEAAVALDQNQGYMDYLLEKGTSLSELFSFCERISKLKDNLIYVCRYLLFFAWVVVLHLIMRCRPALYLAMGIMCILATTIRLSGNMAAACLFGSPDTYHFFADGFVPPLMEAMLTFLIFDITIASMEKLRLDHKLETLYQDLPALQFLIVQLSEITAYDCEYASNISRLLPHFSSYAKSGSRSRKKAKRLVRAIERLYGPHTNRAFLEAAVELQTLLPGK